MRLTWRDAVATVLTGLVVAGWAAYRAGTDLPLLGSARGTALFALVVGIGACAVGGTQAYHPETGAHHVVIQLCTLAGVLALGAAVVTLITGSAAALAVLVAVTAALWLAATLRHALTPRRAPTPEEAPMPGQALTPGQPGGRPHTVQRG